ESKPVERPAAREPAAFDPAQHIKTLSNDEVHFLKVKQRFGPEDIESGISNDQEVRQAKKALQERDDLHTRLQATVQQLDKRLKELDSGFIKRMIKGKEIESVKAQLTRAKQELAAVPAREPLVN